MVRVCREFTAQQEDLQKRTHMYVREKKKLGNYRTKHQHQCRDNMLINVPVPYSYILDIWDTNREATSSRQGQDDERKQCFGSGSALEVTSWKRIHMEDADPDPGGKKAEIEEVPVPEERAGRTKVPVPDSPGGARPTSSSPGSRMGGCRVSGLNTGR